MGPEVLTDINFTLDPGSFHFLTGPSGAGKTSLMSLMYLGRKPTRGLVTMFGQNINQMEVLFHYDYVEMKDGIGLQIPKIV